jgi:hypothetical protein
MEVSINMKPSAPNSWWLQQADKEPEYDWADYKVKVGTVETGRHKFDELVSSPPADLTQYLIEMQEQLDSEELEAEEEAELTEE